MSGRVDPGGAAERPRTIAEALEAFGRARIARSEAHAAGVEAMLEIVACFCDEVAPGLLDPLSRRRLERKGSGAPDTPARYLVEPDALLRLLAPCARLFPYQIVAGAGVLAAFHAEVPRLARWLLRRGVARPADEPAFCDGWRCAVPDIERHVALQVAIEQAVSPLARTHATETVVGRFRVEAVSPEGIHVNAGDTPRGPVRVPPEAAGLFAAGQEVSLAFHRSAIGWTLLAASLPCREGGLDLLLASLAASLL